MSRADEWAMADDGPAWPPVRPLQGNQGLQSFPIDALPGVVGEVVAATATEIQVAPSTVALAVLSGLSVAIGGRVQIRARGRWVVPCVLWTCTALPTGERKSEAFKRVIFTPLDVWTREQRTKKGREVQIANAKRTALEKAKKDASKNWRPGDPDADAALADAVKALDTHGRVLVLPRLYMADASPEAAIDVMASHEGRGAMITAEGGQVFGITAGGHYSGRPNFDNLLKAYTGETITVDRKGDRRGGSVCTTIEHPRLTMALAAQPPVLQAAMENPAFGGRGLLERFLWACPVSLAGWRDTEAPPADPRLVERYDALIVRLLDRWYDAAPVVLALSEEATESFRVFRAEHEIRRRPGHDLDATSPIGGWGARLPELVARLAGILHCAGDGSDEHPVSVDTLERSIRIGEWAVEHARFVFGTHSPDVEGARRILAWIGANLSPGERQFRASVMWKDIRGSFGRHRPNLDSPLRLLVERGYLRLLEPQRGGPGQPAEDYSVNPKAIHLIHHIEYPG